MAKAFTILLFLCALSCISRNEKQSQHAVYDETALKDFVMTSMGPEKEKAPAMMDSVIRDAENDSAIYKKTISFLTRGFGDPNSSFRNAELYSQLLHSEIRSKWYSEAEKNVAQKRLRLLMQNNPGQPANDFSFVSPEGKTRRLYDIKANNILLLFYNPECEACKEMKQRIENSPIINSKQHSGQLKVLAIYTDKDETIWRRHLGEMPKAWIHGRDENEYLYTNGVYDLRAIPTIYLLDKHKKVVLKDCVSVDEIEKKL
ncbi:MAG TPA: thioredoxin-like domain-containing protein [Puia sp.]|nr:thioredoxin-like domain-containing protein [Puia sp.]